MALLPSNCLLMSSHFIPSPLSRMILSSSSGDHLDCFLAGDSDGWTPWSLFVGTVAAAVSGVGSDVVDATAVVGTEGERDEAGTEVVDRASSSSCLRSSEISTLLKSERKRTGRIWRLYRMQSICAASEKVAALHKEEERSTGKIRSAVVQCFVVLPHNLLRRTGTKSSSRKL